MEGPATRIVLLGKTGSGKSSLVHTIFGEASSSEQNPLRSGTKMCETTGKCVNEVNISVTDTPGIFSTILPEKELKAELVRGLSQCAPGPHAVLILVKWGKFAEQEQEVIDQICSYFSDDILKYAVVVFTHGDQLPEGKKIEDFVKESKLVSDLVQKCGNRCHVVDNKYWNENNGEEYRTNQFQVKALLNTIKNMVSGNKGKVYTK